MRNYRSFFYIIIPCLLGMTGALCAQEKNAAGYVIEGIIKDAQEGALVTLTDIDQLEVIDSARLVGGRFRFSGTVKGPTSCWITCLEQYAIVQVDNGDMKFTSSLKDMKLNYVAEGGSEQLLQTQLNKLQRPYERIYSYAYDSLRNKLYKDTLHEIRLTKVFNEANNQYMKIYIDFGKKNFNTYLGLDIVYRNRQAISKDSILLLYNTLSEKLKANEKAVSLKTYALDKILRKGDHYLDFEVRDINGKPFRLSSLKGKYIYLSFGSFGCAPCRVENMHIAKNYGELSKRLFIVNFSLDVNVKEWKAAANQDGIIWDNVSDLAGMAGKIQTLYDVRTMPTSFLINKEGVIVERFDGYDADNFIKVEKIIAEDN